MLIKQKNKIDVKNYMRKILRKGQTALEYLMTYGWAILIVIIAIGALYALGLTKPCRWTGTQITGFTGGGFEASAPRFAASNDNLVLDFKRIGANSVTFNAANATYKTQEVMTTVATTLPTGETNTVTFDFTTVDASEGDCYGADILLNYTESGREFSAAGRVSGTVEA